MESLSQLHVEDLLTMGWNKCQQALVTQVKATGENKHVWRPYQNILTHLFLFKYQARPNRDDGKSQNIFSASKTLLKTLLNNFIFRN